MDCIGHGVAKSQTQLSDFHFHNKEILRQCPAVGTTKDAEKDREKKTRQEEGSFKDNKNKKGKSEKIRVRRSKGKALNAGTSRIPLTRGSRIGKLIAMEVQWWVSEAQGALVLWVQRLSLG